MADGREIAKFVCPIVSMKMIFRHPKYQYLVPVLQSIVPNCIPNPRHIQGNIMTIGVRVCGTI